MFSGKVYVREGSMADLKIRVFKGDKQQPETTITIPGSVLKVASNLIPKKAAASLQDKSIDLDCWQSANMRHFVSGENWLGKRSFELPDLLAPVLASV
jgi:hypothetical protein